MAYDAGSVTSGRAMFNEDRVTEVLDFIEDGLDAVNDKIDTFAFKRPDYDMFAPVIKQVEGISGTILAYEDYQIFFQDAGIAVSPEEYNESYNQWILRSRSFETKDGSFTPDFFDKQLKMKKDPLAILQSRSTAVMNKYNSVFRPNYLWQALLATPTTGGAYYDKFGALRDVVIDESMIETVIDGASAGAKGSLTRNHFRAIANATGVESSDLTFIKEYLNEYPDIDPNDLVMVMSMGSENEMRKIFSDSATLDNIIINGIEGKALEGIPYLVNKKLPDGIVMFYANTPDKPIVAELISDVMEFQGLRLMSERAFNKFPTSLNEVQGSKYKIEDIGEHVIGRHRLIFLDITANASNASSDNLMQTAGFTLITGKRTGLQRGWKNTVV